MTIKQIMPFPPSGSEGERDFWRLKMSTYPSCLSDEIIVGLALVEDNGQTGIEYIVMTPEDRTIRVTTGYEGYSQYYD